MGATSREDALQPFERGGARDLAVDDHEGVIRKTRYGSDRMIDVGLLLGYRTTDPRRCRQGEVRVVEVGSARADGRSVHIRDTRDDDGVGSDAELVGHARFDGTDNRAKGKERGQI